MKAYILGIAGAVLLSAVVSVIAPNGQMGKFVKGGMKLVVLIVLVSPFITFFIKGEIPFLSEDKTISADTVYLETCEKLIKERDEAAIVTLLKEEYGVGAEVRVEYSDKNFAARKKISVKIKDFGIYAEDEHIDIMKKITAALREQYGCDAEVS